jgi:predicted lysophospholipase L1 biosynthesis ABC-type transport system permease subunit
MQETQPPLQTLQDIRRMMERSSRFISLSGWSGISAGVCALAGAIAAYLRLKLYGAENVRSESINNEFKDGWFQ